jgi:translation initiation factor 3 subunit C
VEKQKESKEERARIRAMAKEAAANAALQEAAMTSTKSVIPEESVTAAVLLRRVHEIAILRGRKAKDPKSQLRELEALAKLALPFGPRIEVPILMYVISAQFALQRTLDDYMETSVWKSCATNLQRIAVALDEGYTLVPESVDSSDTVILMSSQKSSKMKAAASATEDGAMAAVAADEKLVNPETGESETQDERAERLRLEKEKKMTDEEKKKIPVVGSLSLHLARLEEEYTKSLQKTSHHSVDYIVRLRDESKLVELLARYQKHFSDSGDTESAAALAQLRIEHIYYRHDSIAKQVDKAAAFYERFGEVSMLHPACITSDDGKGKTDFAKYHPGNVCGKPVVEDTGTDVDFAQLVSDLCMYVYKYGSEKSKTRATICQIYHHALHDRFVDARDLLLMSHLQDSIFDSGDVSTMVMFNRMMVTLGMCAFRLGRIQDAHQCLHDICSGRVRELLAQGINTYKFSDKSAEQEKAEKRRMVPYHQHINLELLEACHLISAMLLEVPNMATTPVDGENGQRRYRVISRTFRKFFDQYNHQVFTGPPEQTRDFVMRSAKVVMKGDWKSCVDYLVNKMEVWALVPGDGAARIKEMLTARIKLEGLRTYLFAFSAQYDSLSLAQLCGMFEMTKSEVHSVVSKMMINRELFASWDQPTETIVLRKVEPNPLQIMALQFAEKAAVLVDANERLLDAQSGTYGYKEEHWKGERDERWHGRRDNNRRDARGRGQGRGSSGRGRGGRGRGGRGGRGDSGRRGGGDNRRRY